MKDLNTDACEQGRDTASCERIPSTTREEKPCLLGLAVPLRLYPKGRQSAVHCTFTIFEVVPTSSKGTEAGN